jgi:hypothetical protein
VWLSTGFVLMIGFIDHFGTQLVTTLNYSAIADFHTSKWLQQMLSLFSLLSLVVFLEQILIMEVLQLNRPSLLFTGFRKILNFCQSQNQSYFTTGGLPPNSSSSCQAPRYSRPEIFFQPNPCGYSPYITSSLIKSLVCLLWICLVFRQVYVSLNSCFHCPFYNTSARTNRKHSSSIVGPISSVGTYLFSKVLPTNGRVYLLIKNLLPSSECCSVACFEVVTH